MRTHNAGVNKPISPVNPYGLTLYSRSPTQIINWLPMRHRPSAVRSNPFMRMAPLWSWSRENDSFKRCCQPDPDLLESEPFCRIRIRNYIVARIRNLNHQFRIQADRGKISIINEIQKGRSSADLKQIWVRNPEYRYDK